MKLFILSILILSVIHIQAQIQPVITFNEAPTTFNMHICSDGEFYYTCNGGTLEDGLISIYSLNGDHLKSYPLELDMRGIIYNTKDKKLYVNTVDKEIVRIIDIDDGTYEVVHSGLYEDAGTSPTLGHKGKLLYIFDKGTVSIFKFAKGEFVRSFSGLKCGEDKRNGSQTVAVDKNYIYTWDAAIKTVYTYDHDGKFVRSFILAEGDFGFSLSMANGLLFVSHSKRDKSGVWYGYDLWK